MVPSNIEEVYYYDYSRPLAGIVPQCLPSLARSSSSRPLTGIVLYDYQIKGFFKDSFSPPYGDGTGEWTDVDSATWFSPPYGDGTKKPMVRKVWSQFSPPYGDGTIQAKPNVPHC